MLPGESRSRLEHERVGLEEDAEGVVNEAITEVLRGGGCNRLESANGTKVRRFQSSHLKISSKPGYLWLQDGRQQLVCSSS
jgi:hypothetical protein